MQSLLSVVPIFSITLLWNWQLINCKDKGIIFKDKRIYTIFDDDELGKLYVSDWTPENGIPCTEDKYDFTERNAKYCQYRCGNNETLITRGQCVNGWLTCFLVRIIDENYNKTKNDVINYWFGHRVKINACTYTVFGDDCEDQCYSACKINRIPTATVKPWYSEKEYPLGPTRGCDTNFRGHCRCALFNEKFKHPVPSFSDPDIEHYISVRNQTYYRTQEDIDRLDREIDELLKKIKDCED